MPKIKPVKISFGTILLIFAALANLARWIGMFTISDNSPDWVNAIIPVLGAFSGLVSGLVIAGGLAFLAHRLGALQPFTPKGRPIIRFWGTLILGITIVVMSAFLLPPYVRMMTPEKLRVEISNITTWSIMSVLVGDLIIVAIALSDGKSAGFTAQAPAKNGSAEASGRSATGKIRSAKISGKNGSLSKSKAAGKADFQCPYHERGCKAWKPTQNSINAHAGKCKFRLAVNETDVFNNGLNVKK